MTQLSASLALSPIDDGAFTAFADPAFEANTGLFGGWTAALLLNAVLAAAPGAEGTVSALTVSFINRIPPGSALWLRPTRLGGGKSITHWRCDLFLEGGEEMVASASIVLTQRKHGDARVWLAMPEAQGPKGLRLFNPPGPFGATVDIHFVDGGDPFETPSARSLSWERTAVPGPMDAVRLVFLSDVGWPRAWALGSAPRASSTLTLSVYLHATPDELVMVGDDYILTEMMATRGEHSTIGARKNIWSHNGTLLVTSEQLCWFR